MNRTAQKNLPANEHVAGLGIPSDADAQYRAGLAHLTKGELSQAAVHFQLAIFLHSSHARAWNDLGRALAGQGKHDRAHECFATAVKHSPDLAEAHNNLGCSLRGKRALDAAAEHLNRAIELKPNHAPAMNNLGHVLRDQGLTQEAIAMHRRALALEPNNAENWNSLGAAYFRAAMLAEGLQAYERAIELNPQHVDARISRAMLWLRQGNFAEGWNEYEWRFAGNKYPSRKFPFPAWDGSPLAGRVLLVHAEQGLGDTLQFIRFLPLLNRYGGTVLCEVQPALLPLLKQSGFTNLLGRNSAVPRCDFHIPLLSVPCVLGTRVETIPAEIPYLSADPALVQHWRGLLAPLAGIKVGIVWQGKTSYKGDAERSIPLKEFAPLARPGVHLISLQKHFGTKQLGDAESPMHVLGLGEHLDETHGAFTDTAAVMANLDLVITSDTAIAHVAGALGVPTWVALPHMPDWRWMDDREDSPWYPTMRLFRQTHRGSWPEVFESMGLALTQFAADKAK